jgi:hypothetical protein
MISRYRSAVGLAMLSVALLSLVACSDDEHITGPFAESDDRTGDSDLGSVSGTVTDATGEPLPFALVEVGAVTGFADDAGRFFVPNLPLEEEIARFSKDTRTTANFRALSLVSGGEVNFPGIALLPLQRGAVFFADQGAEAVVGSSGSGAVFADSSFVDGDAVYIERVAAFMAVTTVGESHFAAAFPGDFEGIRTDGQTVPLEALGVIWTSIDSQVGELALASGKTVRYRLGTDDPDAPPAVTAWTLDLVSGRWHEVGESSLSAGVYEIEAGSIAPICWAVEATDQCEVTGVVQDPGGQPLADTRVEYRDLAGRHRRAVMSGADGSFTMTVSRSDSASITPYFGSIVGQAVMVDTRTECPVILTEPLIITLPDYRIDVSWRAGYGDLDARFVIAGEWVIDPISTGSLDAAPYAQLARDERRGGEPETIVGRRWYDGVSEFWVHDYQNRATEALRGSGAIVDLTINGEPWSFAIGDAVFDAATSDSSGWWHVFDVVVQGASVVVDTVQAFQAEPTVR